MLEIFDHILTMLNNCPKQYSNKIFFLWPFAAEMNNKMNYYLISGSQVITLMCAKHSQHA